MMVRALLTRKSGNATSKSNSKPDINFTSSKKLPSAAKSEPKQLLMKKSLTAKKIMNPKKIPSMTDFSQAVKVNQKMRKRNTLKIPKPPQ